MATAAVIGLSTGKRLLTTYGYYHSDLPDKLTFIGSDQTCSNKNPINTKKSPIFISSGRPPSQPSIRALKEHLEIASDPSTPEPGLFCEETSDDPHENLVDVILLLQMSKLEKQWNLTAETKTTTAALPKEIKPPHRKKMRFICSGTSARRRRIDSRSKVLGQKCHTCRKNFSSTISPDLIKKRSKGYGQGGVLNDELLTHQEVVLLSKKIKVGLFLEEHRCRLTERLGCEPSAEQIASSLKISRAHLQLKLIESSLAREKLAMSNIRLVMSIAQRYDNMGAEMADLIQGGLVGLLRGIEKFDSSKGFKISTYVYWWIRQGVSRTLVENSRTLRLPTHLHERLSLIRNAKAKLEEKGIDPSVVRIAETLQMSQKKVRNATEANSKVYSLDREAFPSLNGLPGETLHSFIADNHVENNPWFGVDEWSLKDEVDKLISSTLREREREIIKLYYGLDDECLTWEDISKRIGLSRERVRQVGLVALEKLKHAARKGRLDAMLVKH